MTSDRRRLMMAIFAAGEGPAYVFNYRNLSFAGNDYIDTGVQLFSAANVTSPFELTSKLGSITGDAKYATAVAAMLEQNPYPGFVIRRNNDNVTPQIACAGNFNFSLSDEVVIKRYNEGLMELYVGGALINRFVIIQQFNTPLTIGAGLNASNQPQRYFYGTLDYTRLKMSDMPFPGTPAYQLSGYEFDGTAATAINTGITLYDANHTNWVLRAKMSNIVYDANYDSMVTCFREQQPYAGFVFRRYNNTSNAQMIGGNANVSNYTGTSFDLTVIRLGSTIYWRLNGAWISSGLGNTHDWPLILGGRLNSSLQIDNCTAFKMEEFKLYIL